MVSTKQINVSLFLAILASILTLVRTTSEQSSQIQYQYYIFSPQCYQSLVLNQEWTNVVCIKQTLSKLMGYGLVIGGGIVKIPQIVRILVDRSVFGISYSSIALESSTNWIVMVYSWHQAIPFSIYGQNFFILAQNLIIIFLFVIFGYKLPNQQKGSATTFYAVFLLALVCIMFLTRNPFDWPQFIIHHSMYCQIALFSSARLSQIFHIFKFKSTGSLSLITCGLIFVGNLGRLFTIFVQINDILFASSVMIATILNLTILVQFGLYWKNTGSNIGDNCKYQQKKE